MACVAVDSFCPIQSCEWSSEARIKVKFEVTGARKNPLKVPMGPELLESERIRMRDIDPEWGEKKNEDAARVLDK
jgi:hypothetical protein